MRGAGRWPSCGANASTSDVAAIGQERGVGGGEAIRLLRASRHLQVIALVIGFAAIGAAIIEQQLNMAAESLKGAAVDRRDHGIPRHR